ncbi:efflux RND transporter periplasmic adaptor subunit [Rhodoferax sp. GW822-FHT02A01]|uniref:efflux RND transporter periplasmic adaptor subunit n=1 Tax=Rhodoferax sp. GW822-FHT02A01 TaxID=3141537 RepID=UPI00315DA7FC
MQKHTLHLTLVCLFLAACGEEAKPVAQAPSAPFVKTISPTQSAKQDLGLSGTIRARVESPIAFQVNGRIAKRMVDAGQEVKAGQVLFALDRRDLELALQSAQADVAAAEAAKATADADLARTKQLKDQGFISTQATDMAQLAAREAHTRLAAAASRQAQSRNGLDYGLVRAPAAGVMLDVVGEQGQVISAGQSIAVLAQAGEREVEVNFPDGVPPPTEGKLQYAQGVLPLKLREVAGSVDPLSRTLRARYTVMENAQALVLGSVVKTSFPEGAGAVPTKAVPLAAVDERGQGPRVWIYKEGHVRALPVKLVAIDGQTAHIQAELPTGAKVVAMGTHLLTDGMPVRELAQ